MSKIIDYFKKKSTIFALLFILVGTIILLVMPLFPHGPIYKSTSKTSQSIGDREYVNYVEFIGEKKIKTYIKFKDNGEIDNLQIVPYSIEDGVLFKSDEKFGEIDIYNININFITINGQKTGIEYVCTASTIAKYVSYALIVIGSLIIIAPIFIKKKTEY